METSTKAAATAAVLSGGITYAQEPEEKLSAVDQVPLGKTGGTICRLGFGAGSDSGSIQRDLGHDGFNRLVRHAYDRGITYFDTADAYQTHTWIREAIKGLPREKLWIQSKMPGTPENPLAEIERYLKELGTDYIDSLLVHCVTTNDWDTKRKRVMDGISKAQEKGMVRFKGVSCHGLPGLTRATEVDWVDVHLVRVNPQGSHVDGHSSKWYESGDTTTVPLVMDEIKKMHEKGRGVIGMKIIGNGDFKKPEDREKSIRFAMACENIDAIVIGFSSTSQIDEAIKRMNRALRELRTA